MCNDGVSDRIWLHWIWHYVYLFQISCLGNGRRRSKQWVGLVRAQRSQSISVIALSRRARPRHFAYAVLNSEVSWMPVLSVTRWCFALLRLQMGVRIVSVDSSWFSICYYVLIITFLRRWCSVQPESQRTPERCSIPGLVYRAAERNRRYNSSERRQKRWNLFWIEKTVWIQSETWCSEYARNSKSKHNALFYILPPGRLASSDLTWFSYIAL